MADVEEIYKLYFVSALIDRNLYHSTGRTQWRVGSVTCPGQIYGNDDTGDKERTNTSASTSHSNPVLKKQFLKHEAKLTHLRQEYSIVRTELGNGPNDNEYKNDDCVRLVRSVTSLMESLSDLAARYQLDAGEVSAQIQELQDMKDQLYVLLVDLEIGRNTKRNRRNK